MNEKQSYDLEPNTPETKPLLDPRIKSTVLWSWVLRAKILSHYPIHDSKTQSSELEFNIPTTKPLPKHNLNISYPTRHPLSL